MKLKMNRLSQGLFGLVALSLSLNAQAKDKKLLPETDKAKLYAQVTQILDYSCLKCHQSTNYEAKGGGLNMETIEGMLKGGNVYKAAVLNKGNGAASMLYNITGVEQGSIADKNPSGAPRGMPLAPAFEKLTTEQREVLKVWIDGGCFVPDEYKKQPFKYRTKVRRFPTSLVYKEVIKAAAKFDGKAYVEKLNGKEDLTIEMVPIPAGKFLFGGKKEVQIDAFYMASKETTWDLYDTYLNDLDTRALEARKDELTTKDTLSAAISRPTPAFLEMSFGMGREDGYPAICMTQLSAKMFCVWLSAKTGKFYRLATEAEWEYACKAGTKGKYFFGDVAKMDDYVWHYDNAGEKYQKVGTKKPNAWGLYDMLGNVSEWTLDHFEEDYLAKVAAKNPILPLPLNPYFTNEKAKDINPPQDASWPYKIYGNVSRGGSWNDDASDITNHLRVASEAWWKDRDPQIPKSVWWMTDSTFAGFRIVCDPTPPKLEDLRKYWPNDEEIKAIPSRN